VENKRPVHSAMTSLQLVIQVSCLRSERDSQLLVVTRRFLFDERAVGFEVFMAVTMKNAVFWDVAP
jgi:hypothetical protein